MLHHHAITVLAALRALIHDDVRDERGDAVSYTHLRAHET